MLRTFSRSFILFFPDIRNIFSRSVFRYALYSTCVNVDEFIVRGLNIFWLTFALWIKIPSRVLYFIFLPDLIKRKELYSLKVLAPASISVPSYAVTINKPRGTRIAVAMG